MSNFTAAMLPARTVKMVTKIAIPPPSATAFSLCRSAEGRDTKPTANDNFLTKAVNTTDAANESSKRIIANIVNCSILSAPIICFLPYQRNQDSSAEHNQDKYSQKTSTCLYHTSMLLQHRYFYQCKYSF